jgi:uncharacterized membrane protein YccF (DUF307 family)
MQLDAKNIGALLEQIWTIVRWVAQLSLVVLAVAHVFQVIGLPIPRIPIVDATKLAALAVVFYCARV